MNFKTGSNAIYVRFETVNTIRKTYTSLQESALKWDIALNISTDDLSKRHEAFEDYMLVRKDISELLELLQKDFQEILGFPVEEKKSVL